MDCDYYRPEFTELERRVKQVTNTKLTDYILKIAGGATPEKDESEKYYTTGDQGVPFIRVQNLSPEGLQLDDCKYINLETHHGLLKRSQVKEFDLLTKITGVGRMAISSVAPAEFEGNINQHIVVMQTKDRETSEVLATFLNTDVGEKLAKRRSTGGTRPALDYEALKTIPIIYKPEIVTIMNDAYAQKQQQERDAAALLQSIDGYVLQELGISLPDIKEQKVFTVNIADIEDRLDPFHYQPKFLQKYACLRNGKYPAVQLGSVMLNLLNGKEFRTYSEKGFRYLRVTDLGEHGINNNSPRYIDIPEIPLSIRLSPNDFLISRSGSLGLVSVVTDEISDAVLSSHIFKVSLDTQTVLPSYLQAFLRSSIGQFQFFHKNNGGIIPEINQPALKSIEIILPPLEVQNRLAAEVAARVTRANELHTTAQAVVAQAKAEVERRLFA